MKLREEFITHQSGDEHVMVAAGADVFSGMVRSNSTAGFIIELLKNETTKEEIVLEMLEKYDADKAVIEADVEKIITQLKSIGAINE